MITYDYTNVLYADIVIATVTIVLGFVLWKNTSFRYPLLVLGTLYGLFTLLWHFPIDIYSWL